MTTYVQGLSALAHYRSSQARMDAEHCSADVRSLANACSSVRVCTEAKAYQLGIGEPTPERPLEVLVANSRQRSRSRAVVARVWKSPIAPTAFRKVSNDIYVSSPEFVFLQLAPRLKLPELIALGMELCGTYRRNVEVPHLGMTDSGYITLFQQQPLSTPKRLKGFLETMKSAPGCAKARKALDYVLPGSASPMETVLYLLLCLPRRLGGYALPKPVLNPPIVLSKAGRMHTLRSLAKPDLYWPDYRIDLEYNSDEFHDESSRTLDSMRRKALERMNVEVIELTHAELCSTDLFHATVLRIARRIGKQLRPVSEGSFVVDRANLRHCLLVEDNNSTAFSNREDSEAGIDSSSLLGEDRWMSDEDVLIRVDEPGDDYYDRDFWADESQDSTWTDNLADFDDNWSFVIAEDPDDDDLHVFGRGRVEVNPA